jgi:hypothetical protein
MTSATGEHDGVYILVPHTQSDAPVGGVITQFRLSAAIGAGIIRYTAGNATALLASIAGISREAVFIVSIGHDVQWLLSTLNGRRIVYWAQTIGWGIRMPPGVAILCSSRYTMGYWGETAPGLPIYRLPNIIDPEFDLPEVENRSIDVLLQRRKSSSYLLDTLAPLLSRELNVEIAENVPDLSERMKHSKVFLYDSREFWHAQQRSEGFGLPPLEAAACGCVVFSSLNAGLSDYLDPGHGWSKIGTHSAEYDRARICQAVADFVPIDHSEIVSSYRGDAVAQRWTIIREDLERFWRAGQASLEPSVAFSGYLSRPVGPRSFHQRLVGALRRRVRGRWAALRAPR